MTTLEILIAARKRIEKEENWTFLPREGAKVCAIFALYEVGAQPGYEEPSFQALHQAAHQLEPYSSVVAYNAKGHKFALAMFDKAIANEAAKAAANNSEAKS